MLVQRRLALEVPAVGARRAQLFRQVERVVGDAMEAELGPGPHARRAACGGDLHRGARRRGGRCGGAHRSARAARWRRRRSTRSSTPRSPSPRRVWRPCPRQVRARPAARAPPSPSSSPAGGACTAAMFSGRRKLLYSMIEIWIAAATGIASSAPRMPKSVEPKSTEVRTTNGADLHGPGLDPRLDDVVLDLLVDDRPDRPDDRRRREVVEERDDADEDRAERRADERHEVEQEDDHRERAREGHAEDRRARCRRARRPRAPGRARPRRSCRPRCRSGRTGG